MKSTKAAKLVVTTICLVNSSPVFPAHMPRANNPTGFVGQIIFSHSGNARASSISCVPNGAVDMKKAKGIIARIITVGTALDKLELDVTGEPPGSVAISMPIVQNMSCLAYNFQASPPDPPYYYMYGYTKSGLAWQAPSCFFGTSLGAFRKTFYNVRIDEFVPTQNATWPKMYVFTNPSDSRGGDDHLSLGVYSVWRRSSNKLHSSSSVETHKASLL
jgi:hypothetical protein